MPWAAAPTGSVRPLAGVLGRRRRRRRATTRKTAGSAVEPRPAAAVVLAVGGTAFASVPLSMVFDVRLDAGVVLSGLPWLVGHLFVFSHVTIVAASRDVEARQARQLCWPRTRQGAAPSHLRRAFAL